MEKLIMPRYCGKTTQLIKRSAKSGDYIVCYDMREASNIQQQAIQLDLNIPYPITYDEFLSKRYFGKTLKVS